MRIFSWLKQRFLGKNKKYKKKKNIEDIPINIKNQCLLPLLDLPVSAIIKVIRLLTFEERIKLSLSSKIAENYIRLARIKVDHFSVHIRDELSNIHLEGVRLFCGIDYFIPQKGDIIMREDLDSWLHKNESSFENTVIVFQKIQQLFICKSFNLIFDLPFMETTKIKEVLAVPDFQSPEVLTVYRGKIETEDLDLVMEMGHDDREIHIEKTEIPLDYGHENAFKFHCIFYDDARWVRIEHLFSLKNSLDVQLGKNTLNCSDANTFIKYWINSDCDMFRWMEVKIQKRTRMKEKVLLDGLVTLKTFRFGLRYLLFAAKPSEFRKQSILCVQWHQDTFQMFTLSPDEPVVSFNKKARSFKKEYEILKILNENKKLEDDLKTLEESEELQKITETTVKKWEILYEIQKLLDELKARRVFFFRGKAIVE